MYIYKICNNKFRKFIIFYSPSQDEDYANILLLFFDIHSYKFLVYYSILRKNIERCFSFSRYKRFLGIFKNYFKKYIHFVLIL